MIVVAMDGFQGAGVFSNFLGFYFGHTTQHSPNEVLLAIYLVVDANCQVALYTR